MISPPERDPLIDRFLADVGWGGARRAALAGDASFRRYERVTGTQGTAVLMDAPPPTEDVRPFLRVARHLLGLGYSAPEIYAEDVDNGFLLLEDFGDETFTRVLAAGGDEPALYAAAVDVLIDLHSRAADAAIPDGLAPYDTEKLLTEASLLTDWYLAAQFAHAPDETLRQSYLDLWRRLTDEVDGFATTLVLRDFHVDNLIWLPDRDGVRNCGLLDFQDAVSGPAPYDLMSLLEDARRDIAPDLIAEMKARYFAALPDYRSDAFDAAFAILAAQRHCKVIGIFTRLAVRDGKFDYLGHIPRVWRLLETACRHPALADLAAWLDAHVPAQHRGIPEIREHA